MKKFITDLGRSYILRGTDVGETITLPRFAVWTVCRRHKDGRPSEHTKPMVIEVYDTLDELEDEHGHEIPWHNLESIRHERTRR